MSKTTEPIDQGWIKIQVDTLLDVAKKMGPGPMQYAILLRVDHYIDLVKAWRESS